MKPSSSSLFPLVPGATGLMLALAGVAWLLFGVAGQREGRLDFPTPEGGRLAFLVDSGGRLGVEEVAASPEGRWTAWEGQYLWVEAGRTLWLKVTLPNPGPEGLHGVLADSEYLPDRIEAWQWVETAREPGRWQGMASGEAVPGVKKPIWSRTAAFPVAIGPGAEAVLYLKVTDFYRTGPWLRWWPRASDFYQAQVRDLLAEAICYGWLLALVVYNLVLWMRLRFPDIGWYVGYAATMAVFNFASNGGLALAGIGAASPVKEMVTGGALALSAIFFLQFARIFLKTDEVLPRLRGGLRWTLMILSGLFAGALLMPWFPAALWMDAIVVAVAGTYLLLLAVAWRSWRRGVRHAPYFLAAFGLLFAGGMPAVVAWVSGDMQAWAAMALLLAAVLEMSVLSFAVADRFAQIERQLLEEIEQRQMMQETYLDELELEVSARTEELARAATDKDRILSTLGHDLRSPLTGLLQMAEEPAMAGSRLAREVSGTARSLLQLIEELVLWARLRAGAWTLTEVPVEAVTGPALALHRGWVGQRRLQLTLDVSEQLRVRTDQVLAQTLVRNLLSNALKWARSEVILSVREDAVGGVCFDVRNDGEPVPEAVVRAVRAGRAEAIPGGRMGLRLCLEISRVLGSGLDVRNGEEGWVEVSFVLPCAAGERACLADAP